MQDEVRERRQFHATITLQHSCAPSAFSLQPIQSDFAFPDRSEVKVMSDLAMISAGDTALDVDKVACFNSAVMGFAPFLFDLRAEDGLVEVLQQLKNVWDYMQRDERILKKWVSSDGCLLIAKFVVIFKIFHVGLCFAIAFAGCRAFPFQLCHVLNSNSV